MASPSGSGGAPPGSPSWPPGPAPTASGTRRTRSPAGLPGAGRAPCSRSRRPTNRASAPGGNGIGPLPPPAVRWFPPLGRRRGLWTIDRGSRRAGGPKADRSGLHRGGAFHAPSARSARSRWPSRSRLRGLPSPSGRTRPGAPVPDRRGPGPQWRLVGREPLDLLSGDLPHLSPAQPDASSLPSKSLRASLHEGPILWIAGGAHPRPGLIWKRPAATIAMLADK